MKCGFSLIGRLSNDFANSENKMTSISFILLIIINELIILKSSQTERERENGVSTFLNRKKKNVNIVFCLCKEKNVCVG